MKRRIALLLIPIVEFALAWSLGLGDLVREPQQLQQVILGLGAWGYLFYVLSFKYKTNKQGVDIRFLSETQSLNPKNS